MRRGAVAWIKIVSATPYACTMGNMRKPAGAKAVVIEIRGRERQGLSLASGANRGDWLYAAAVRFFGSWGRAVEAAGFAYGGVKQANLAADDVLLRIRRLADAGEPLRAGEHSLESSAARRHFGSWQAAVEAAGCELPSPLKWTAHDVVEQIREDLRRGLPLGSLAVIARNQPLYGAARRRFGSWAAALAAAAPSRPCPRRGRPRRGDGAAP